MNKRIYTITTIISVILILPALIWVDCSRLTVIAGAGCSGLAAAIMAFFMDNAAEKNEKINIQKGRTRYLSTLYHQISVIIGQLLWMNNHIDDAKFGWDYFNDRDFFTTKHAVFLNSQNVAIENDEHISIDEAVNRLNELSHSKFEWGKFQSLPTDTQKRYNVMFFSLIDAHSDLIQATNSLDRERLQLECEKIMTLEETDTLYNELTRIIFSMQPSSIYPIELAPGTLADVIKLLSDYSLIKDDIAIGRHTTLFSR